MDHGGNENENGRAQKVAPVKSGVNSFIVAIREFISHLMFELVNCEYCLKQWTVEAQPTWRQILLSLSGSCIRTRLIHDLNTLPPQNSKPYGRRVLNLTAHKNPFPANKSTAYCLASVVTTRTTST